MHERFSDEFRKVFELATIEAHRLNHEHLGTEHALLALTKIDGMAAKFLKELDVDVQKFGLDVENSMEKGQNENDLGKLPQTEEMKRVFQHAMEEAESLNHRSTGTQHLLLGLLRERNAMGVSTLWDALGITFEDARSRVAEMGSERPVISPSGPDHAVRGVIKSCWEILPEEIRNVDEVERQVRRIVDRALRDFREDFEEFGTSD